MQFSRDAAPLVILHGQQTTGKASERGSAVIDQPLQLDGAITNRLLEQLAVVDVGAGPVPFHDLSFEISDRNCTSPEPAVLSVPPANAVFRFIVVTRLDAVHPLSHTALHVFWMQKFQPTEAIA